MHLSCLAELIELPFANLNEGDSRIPFQTIYLPLYWRWAFSFQTQLPAQTRFTPLHKCFGAWGRTFSSAHSSFQKRGRELQVDKRRALTEAFLNVTHYFVVEFCSGLIPQLGILYPFVHFWCSSLHHSCIFSWLQALIERTNLNPAEVGDIVVGTVLAPGSLRAIECRMAAFYAGFPGILSSHPKPYFIPFHIACCSSIDASSQVSLTLVTSCTALLSHLWLL